MKIRTKKKEATFSVEEGTGKTTMAKMGINTSGGKKKGKTTRIKTSGKENIMDRRAMTEEYGKGAAKELTERSRYEYEKKLNKMLKNLK